MKENIAIIMGGFSSEVEISLKSGKVVYETICKKTYNVYRVPILKDKWVVLDDEDNEYPINKDDFSTTINNQKITFDCVFNAIHGAPGENGGILAYFELLGIKHTSAPWYQMALTFNKKDCLSVVREFGVKTANYFYLSKGETINTTAILKAVNGLPCFVKPNNAGSSFGISKVNTIEELLPAIKKAFKEDTDILIEEFLNGTEVTVGVIQYNHKIKVLPITEIVAHNDFFDYEAKYQGKSDEITPARISKENEEKVIQICKKIYKKLKMEGFSRSEFIMVNNEPYFLEMNTVPGLTKHSLIPQQAAAANISLQSLFHNAIKMALKK